MCASIVTKEQKMKLFYAKGASGDQSRSLWFVMSVKQTLLMKQNLRQVAMFILIFLSAKQTYMSQMLYAGQSAREDVPFLCDF